MAVDEDLVERVREVLAPEGVPERRMFGGLAFLVGGHMSVAASGQGGLMVRVDPAQTEALLREPGAAPMEMGGRGPSRGWVVVAAEALADDEVLRGWVERGVAYARSLPPKH